MKWSNVRIIFLREARDQLRDRRTLFTIAILPLLLYPLLGMVFMQIAQFTREHPTQIRLFGIAHLPAEPPLLEGDQFHSNVFRRRNGELLTLILEPEMAPQNSTELRAMVEADIRAGLYDAAVYFPPKFAEELTAFRRKIQERSDASEVGEALPALPTPKPEVFFNTASDKSRIALARVERILENWRESIVRENLKSRHIPESATEPFELEQTDLAQENSRRAAVWSKVMPFVVLIWALTGAFYPAIDLCAGEKERGTLETLLSSPAERSEIVWGKLLTVMAFSIATSVLNMASAGLTMSMFLPHLGAMAGGSSELALGPPPPSSVLWLLLALLPTSAMFSALALAIAAFARSSKEGQYYLMPMLFITLPLMLLPMLPTAELNLGTALIPVTGVMMLLRVVIEGQYAHALLYLPPIAGVTAVCCLLAIRWAVDQFSNESVLFRESERVGLTAWLRHLARHRGDTPSVPEALLCGIMLIMIRFFATFHVSTPQNWGHFAMILVITQVALIATPVLLMTLILTRSPRQTLSLNVPRPLSLVAAMALAIFLQPVVQWLSVGIEYLYPINPEMAEQLKQMNELIGNQLPLGAALLLIGLLPAICEELAFRGFILSGLRHMGHKWAAIVISAVFFGWTHALWQQQLSAAILGVVIGFVAVQTGSLLPAIAFHLTHNSLLVLQGHLADSVVADQHWWNLVFQTEGEFALTRPWVAVVGGLLAALVLYGLHRLPYRRSSEEELQQALDHQAELPAAAALGNMEAGS